MSGTSTTYTIGSGNVAKSNPKVKQIIAHRRPNAAVTNTRLHDMGYGTRPMHWRMAAMTPEWLNVKIDSLQHKITVFNDTEFAQSELLRAYNEIDDAIKTNKISFSELKQLIVNINPKMWESLQIPLREQFARGVAKNIFELPLGITNLEDVDVIQRIDAHGVYFAYELLSILNDKIFYRNITIEKTDNHGFILKGPDPTDPNNIIELATAKLIKGAKTDNYDKIVYELTTNSQQGVLQLIDSVAQMRQGENNAISIQQVGSTIDTLTFLYEALVVNHMHVIMSDAQQREFLDDIDNLEKRGYDKNKVEEIRKLAEILIANRDLYHYETPRRLNPTKRGANFAAATDRLEVESSKFLDVLGYSDVPLTPASASNVAASSSKHGTSPRRSASTVAASAATARTNPGYAGYSYHTGGGSVVAPTQRNTGYYDGHHYHDWHSRDGRSNDSHNIEYTTGAEQIFEDHETTTYDPADENEEVVVRPEGNQDGEFRDDNNDSTMTP